MLAERVHAKGEAQFIEMLTEGSPRARAFATCGLAAYSIAGKGLSGLVSAKDRGAALLGALSVAGSGAACVKEWRAADIIELRRFSEVATWERDIDPVLGLER